jgi:hypothetical protein
MNNVLCLSGYWDSRSDIVIYRMQAQSDLSYPITILAVIRAY